MSKLLRVLAVEDSEADAFLLETELREGGFEPVVERVETEAAMRQTLTRQKWDVVVSDSSLPCFNALSALAVLKQSGQDVPFFLVSGVITEEAAAAASQAGAYDCIVKNRLTQLAPAIERALHEPHAQLQRPPAGPGLSHLTP